MITLQERIDGARRDMAEACFAVKPDLSGYYDPEDVAENVTHRREQIVADWALTIEALYKAKLTHPEAPTVAGYELAGRTKDGSFIFTADGKNTPYVSHPDGKKKTVTRKTSSKDFPVDHYIVDSEFNSWFPGDFHPEQENKQANNDLFFGG